MRRVLLLFGVCCCSTLAPLLTLEAQPRDLRLVEAVKRRDQKAFAALLRARADVNAAQPDGSTALSWAVHLGQRSMADALLDAGANANTADEYGATPVTLAAADGEADPVPRLISAGGDARTARWDGEAAPIVPAGPGGRRAALTLTLPSTDA